MTVFVVDDDLRRYAGVLAFVEHTDLDADGIPDVDPMADALAFANNLALAAVRKAGYALPFTTPVPATLRRHVMALAIYELEQARTIEQTDIRAQQAREYFARLAAGLECLVDDEGNELALVDDAAPTGSASVVVPEDTRYDTLLKGWQLPASGATSV